MNVNLIGNSAAPKKAVAAATVFFFVALKLEKLNFSVCDATWGILPWRVSVADEISLAICV